MATQPGQPFVPPRAPSQAAWDAMSPEERQRVLDELPNAVTEAELSPPEGDFHRDARVGAFDELTNFFEGHPRGVYVGSELTVYYPDTQRFAPDLLVVFDVDPHPREKWVVSAEGKGLDFVLEVHYGGDRKKDTERNVQLYAQVGIPEYVIFDRRRLRLIAYRLGARGRYEPVLPQRGRYPSAVLGLDLALDGERLVFYHRSSQLLGTRTLLGRLQTAVDETERRREEAERARAEAERARAEAERERAEAERALEEARARIAELERRLGDDAD